MPGLLILIFPHPDGHVGFLTLSVSTVPGIDTVIVLRRIQSLFAIAIARIPGYLFKFTSWTITGINASTKRSDYEVLVMRSSWSRD